MTHMKKQNYPGANKLLKLLSDTKIKKKSRSLPRRTSDIKNEQGIHHGTLSIWGVTDWYLYND